MKIKKPSITDVEFLDDRLCWEYLIPSNYATVSSWGFGRVSYSSIPQLPGIPKFEPPSRFRTYDHKEIYVPQAGRTVVFIFEIWPPSLTELYGPYLKST